MSKALQVIALLIAVSHVAIAQTPLCYWHSDPVCPDETVMLYGEDLDKVTQLAFCRLDDGHPGEPPSASAKNEGTFATHMTVKMEQQSRNCIKFIVPPNTKPGLYSVRLTALNAEIPPVLLNLPDVWWVQGDIGISASPGGWVRAFGKCLCVGEGAPSIALMGAQKVILNAEGDGFALRAALPDNLPPGDYQVYVHNGCGGQAGWSKPLPMRIEKPVPWPDTILNVCDFGAAGHDLADDTAAIQATMDRAKAAGGGVVYFPRGRYMMTHTLVIPPKVTLRGQKRELTMLFWPDMEKPPTALIQGQHSFAIEDLTIYCSNHIHVIAAELYNEPMGDVHLRRIRVRADMYRGHLKPEEVDERFRAALKSSTGGGDLLRLAGPNVEVVDCDLYGSGRALYLLNVRGARIANNTLYNGRWGWYCFTTPDGLIFEDNELIGADLMSTGGGINTLTHTSSCSQNVYYARNRLRLMHGWDREAMTSDGGGGAYFGQITEAQGKSLILADDPKWNGRNWKRAGVFILDGRGKGQYRQIVSYDGRKIELDREWAVPPDKTSWITVTMMSRNLLFIGNQFEDAGIAIQLYGMAMHNISAGNKAIRSGGFHNFGMNYHGIQPSWFVQWLDNEILEGNAYRSGHDNYMVSGDSHLGVYALPPRADFEHPLTLCAVVRRNRLHNNARIEVGGTDPLRPDVSNPIVQDVIVENNRVENADVGIFVRRAGSGFLLRRNVFVNVKKPILDELELIRAKEQKLQALLNRTMPIAHWTFDKWSSSGVVPDLSGNGFDATVYGLVTHVPGGFARFAHEGHLVVDNGDILNFPNITIVLRINPDRVQGRMGLVGKRMRGCPAPYILSLWDGSLEFEATDSTGKWSFNFRTPAVIKPNEWQHVAVVVKEGEGVTIYANGKPVSQKKNALKRAMNSEPLVIGREAWAGQNNVHTPCFYQGMIAEVKLWARALTAQEILNDYQLSFHPE